jgi:hypothetical protein
MAQHQRDPQWESPIRKVARMSAKRREYLQLLEEKRQEQLPRPQTGPLRPVRIEDHIDTPRGWYGYVEALEQQRQQREMQEAREHAHHMNTAHRKTQNLITNILSSITPSPSFQRQNTDEISLSGIASQETVLMPAIPSSPEKRREVSTPHEIEEVALFLNYAVNLYVFTYNETPTHIRLSSYNYRRLSLEYQNTILSAYTNQRGTFFLIPDYRLDDATIICEEHVPS